MYARPTLKNPLAFAPLLFALGGGLTLATPAFAQEAAPPQALDALTPEEREALEAPEEAEEMPVEPAAVKAAPAVAEVEDEDDLVITGTRTRTRFKDAPVVVEVIDRATLEASGATSLAELLQTQANVRLEHTQRGVNASLRGLDARHTLVLVDGQRVGGRVDGALDMGRYPVEHLERIEIVRGAGSALYGADAVGGIIHLITRKARKPLEAQLSAQMGTLGQYDVTGMVAGQVGSLSGRLTAGHHHIDSFSWDPAGVATSGPEQRSTSAGGDLRWKVSPRHTLSLAGEYTDRKLASVDVSAGGAIFDRIQQTDMLTLRLAHEYKADGGTVWRSQASVNQHDDQLLNDQRKSSALDSLMKTRLTLGTVETQVDYSLSNHRLSVGLEGLGEYMESPRLDEGTGSRIRGAIYVQDQWTLGGLPSALLSPSTYMVLVAGARVDLDSDFGAFASPRISFRVDPYEWLAIQTSLGLGFRAPESSERLLLFENTAVGYRVEGNPDLIPEVSRSADLTFTVRPIKALELRVGGFFNHIDNLIDMVGDADFQPGTPVVFRYENVDAAITAGVESSLRYTRPYWWMGTSYTWTYTRDLGQKRPLAGRAPHEVSAELGGREPVTGLNASVRSVWNAERPYFLSTQGMGEEDQVAAAYVSVDVRAGWQINRYVELFATGQNLTDSGDHILMLMPPRRFTGGVMGRY